MLVKQPIIDLLKKAGVSGSVELTTPPDSELGDLAFACFGLAKEWKKSPVECAKELAGKLRKMKLPKLLEKVEHDGPYVNFFLNTGELAKLVLKNQKSKIQNLKSKIKNLKSRIMVEFAHPNTHKPVHIGHLRNMITGESLVRLLENQGYKVIRANYQGDVGMHIAKCLWGIGKRGMGPLAGEAGKEELESLRTVSERAKFLGEVYAEGGKAYEADEQAKKEIEEINAKIYSGVDKKINEVYKLTRKWSLEYFDYIYKRVGVKKFDRLYFESETYEPGKKIVLAGLKKGIFKIGEGGAIIFEGSQYGLHDRVFVNSRGLPIYEAKDQALARLQFKEYKPEKILHVVAKEQTEYFKVVLKALEFTLPESRGREEHLVYGWVSLKDGKMSSRTGQVVLAEWLLDEAEKKIGEVMKDREIKNKNEVIRRIANAAVKYSMLKTSIHNDIIFDVNEAVSLSGDSGPYLLYIVARINSILKKSKLTLAVIPAKAGIPEGSLDSRWSLSRTLIRDRSDNNRQVELTEKQLLLYLARFLEVQQRATEEKDPSQIAKYLFVLAQAFNNFYQVCPVLQAEADIKNFRLQLVNKVREVMTKGLELLGIDVVDEM